MLLVQAKHLQSRRSALHLQFMTQGSNKYTYAGVIVPILRRTGQYLAAVWHPDRLTTCYSQLSTPHTLIGYLACCSR